MATTYIIGRVENGEYGIAIAYCTVLDRVDVCCASLAAQKLVGERRLRRTERVQGELPVPPVNEFVLKKVQP
jgi:iron(III) transport system permease protein